MVMFDKLQLKNVHVIINKVDFSLTFHMTMNNFDIIWSQQYWAWMMDLQISINLTKTCKHTTSQQLVHVLCPLSFSSAEYLQTSYQNKVKYNPLNYYQNFSSSVCTYFEPDEKLFREKVTFSIWMVDGEKAWHRG